MVALAIFKTLSGAICAKVVFLPLAACEDVNIFGSAAS